MSLKLTIDSVLFTIDVPNPVALLIASWNRLRWWAARRSGRARVYVSCTGAMFQNGGPPHSRFGILSFPVRIGWSVTAWECPHSHLSQKRGRGASDATDNLAYRCAEREARRRGWKLVEPDGKPYLQQSASEGGE